MSKKDFDRYYLEIKNQYLEMLSNMEEFSKTASDEMISSDIIENMKALVEPIKQNYMTLSYVSFLLDKPKRTHKIDKYVKMNKKKLNTSNGRTQEDVINQNKELLAKMEGEINGRTSK